MLESIYESRVPLVDPASWMPTGLYSLDLLSGRGYLKGSIVQVFGESQSRKSTVSLVNLAAAQRAGMATFLFDKESGFLEHVALVCGVDPTPPELLLPKGQYGYFSGKPHGKNQKIESPGFLIEQQSSGSDTIERTFLEIYRVCQCCERSGIEPFIVVDSLSVLTTEQEKFKGMSGETRMTHAKELRKCQRILMPYLAKCRGVLLVIDHLKPTGISGGSSTAFFAGTRVHVSFVQNVGMEGMIPTGFESQLSTTTPGKSRYAAPNTAPFVFDYDSGVCKSEDVLWAGQQAGIISQGGGGFYSIPGLPSSVSKFRGIENWKAFYDENVAPNIQWFEHKLSQYYVDQWKNWCIVGGIDPDTHLRLFGDEVYERATAHMREIDVVINTPAPTKKAKKKQTTQEDLLEIYDLDEDDSYQEQKKKVAPKRVSKKPAKRKSK